MSPHFYDRFSFGYSIFSFHLLDLYFFLRAFCSYFMGTVLKYWWKFLSLLSRLTKFCFLQGSTFSHLRFPYNLGAILDFLNVYNWNLSLFVHGPPLSLQLGSRKEGERGKGADVYLMYDNLSSRTALSAPHLSSAFGSAWNCYVGFQRAQWLISWWFCPLKVRWEFPLLW